MPRRIFYIHGVLMGSLSLLAYYCKIALLDPGDLRTDGYLMIRNGRVAGWRERKPRNVKIVDLPGNIIIPGLVNAHAHLRYSHLAGKIARGRSFTKWIANILAAAPPTAAGVLSGACEMFNSGTTCAGDFDSDGMGARAMQQIGMRGVAFREFVAFDPDAAKAAAREVLQFSKTYKRTKANKIAVIERGAAPHAPYTVVPGAVRALSRARVAMHYLETEEEREWIERGTGPIERLLWARGRRPKFPIPNCSPIEYLQSVGLLKNGTLLIHANALTKREILQIAAAGCVAVHCPGTHAFFRRGAPPVYDWLRAGLPFALGTDSLASNDTLDLFCEMSRLADSDPRIAAKAILESATLGGGRALRLRNVGALRHGFFADFVILDNVLNISRPRRLLHHDLLDCVMNRPNVVDVRTASYTTGNTVNNSGRT
ncbi:MAG: amidohydrolase family protein [Planctomycetota bacterium]